LPQGKKLDCFVAALVAMTERESVRYRQLRWLGRCGQPDRQRAAIAVNTHLV
jgi:hypothetical protein